MLCIDVRDTGIGIPHEQQDQLFQPFSRVYSKVAQPLGGAGLGLSICHGIVEQLGGTIRFNSTVGIGTSFHVELPCAMTTTIATTVAPSPMPSALSALAPLQRVLLVEDHPGNREAILAQLEFLGLQAQAAQRGLAGVDTYRDGSFDAVLLDCNLPDITGYEVARCIRRIEQEEGRVPATLVAISASVEAHHRDECRASGMDIVLTKPLPLGALREALGLPLVVSAPSTPIPRPDIRAVFTQQLLQDLEAIDRAIEQRELDLVRAHAHRICGASGFVNEMALGSTARQLADVEDGAVDHWQTVSWLQTALRQLACDSQRRNDG